MMCAVAQGAMAQHKGTVKRGQTIQIFSWMYFDDNCRITSIPTIRALFNPKLGKLAYGTGKLKINRVVDTRQSNCIGKSREGRIVTYTAGSKAGVDKFTLARKRERGKDQHIQFEITVR